LKSFFVDPDKFFAPPRVLSKAIICDPIKPRGKTGFATKAADVFVSSQERFLREVIGECGIGSDELAQHTAHTRLMPPNQLPESVLIVVNKNSRNEICID
jgi:hypothetical protein